MNKTSKIKNYLHKVLPFFILLVYIILAAVLGYAPIASEMDELYAEHDSQVIMKDYNEGKVKQMNVMQEKLDTEDFTKYEVMQYPGQDKEMEFLCELLEDKTLNYTLDLSVSEIEFGNTNYIGRTVVVTMSLGEDADIQTILSEIGEYPYKKTIRSLYYTAGNTKTAELEIIFYEVRK
jgi:hypothetical protein